MKTMTLAAVLTMFVVLAAGEARAESFLRHRDVDRNRDGAVSSDEWRFSGDQKFAFLDRDGNGSLSRQEMDDDSGSSNFSGSSDSYGNYDSGRRRGGKSRDFVDFDTDQNGVISQNEWSWKPTTFTRLDSNGDGLISQVEFSNRRQNQAAAFAELDENGDGRIARNEWSNRGGAGDVLTSLDLNKDNVLTRDEFPSKEQQQAATATPAETPQESGSGGIEQLLLQLLSGK